MKNRFSTLDLRASISELQKKYQGMRVMSVYDVDSKTYLIKLARPDQKAMILLESGIRIHSTDFQWPKNITPSSFSMKLRKHLRTRRLEKIEQIGIDRIIDIQFGINEAAYHIILELYDRGNIVLTDHEYMILTILRPRTDQSEDVRFAVHQKYPVESAKQAEGLVTHDKLTSILMGAKEGDNLKKVLNPNLVYGPALIDHSLQSAGIPANARIGKEFNISEDMPKLMMALEQAESILESSVEGCKGYIIQKKEKKTVMKDGEQPEELLTYSEFHPFLFKQHENQSYVELDSFDKSVDEFFSSIGSQKLDMKTLQQERAALKKLDHIKQDHEKRLVGLKQEQDVDMNKACLIQMNLDLVDRAIVVVRSAIANQIDWDEIHTIVKEAQTQGDPVASSIKTLKLATNHITVFLKNPYLDSDEEADPEDSEAVASMKVDIDLELTAYANARKYFDKKRKAAAKEKKTVDASTKALKSAEKKTFETLKEVQTVATINKARKTHWFEKFLWFISSENYVVIGGRDQQQNEFIVKKHLRPGDVYVHADLHGASSVIIKNPSGEPIAPKTLNEAGTMALCNSAAWQARVVTSAWWVYHHQVSKTAPTGEYLGTGSFMIRGKKNYLPPSYLIYGFGFMFKVDEESVFRHKGERRVRTIEDDSESVVDSVSTDATADSNDVELECGESSDSDNETQNDDRISTDDSKTRDDASEDVKLAQTSEDILHSDNDSVGAGVQNIKLESDSEHSHLVDSVNDKEPCVRDDVTINENNESGECEEAQAEGISHRDDDDSLFPDTDINLQYVQGEKLRVQTSHKTIRMTSTGSVEEDTTPVEISKSNHGGARLTAKQRREMKKKSRGMRQEECGSVDDMNVDQKQPELPIDIQDPLEETDTVNKSQPQQKKSKQKQEQPEPPQAKRGQKAKLKKIKDKYGDQDEEERQLKMEILASGGAPKEDKKKAKKGKQQGRGLTGQKSQGQNSQGQKSQGQKLQGEWPHRKLTVDDIKEESPILTEGSTVIPSLDAIRDDDASDDEKQSLLDEENIKLRQDINDLDSLSGIPDPDDILHFCMPVCAPYSAILNYKYKVKLTPGNTKRGKAAKTAVHAFQHDKNVTKRERDLFKSLKDVDVSRNIPGKVKVSAQHLIKQKRK